MARRPALLSRSDLLDDGGFLGLAMGMAGGLARGSFFRVRAAIVGLLLGMIVATSASLIVVSVFYKKYDPETGDLVLPMLMHGAIWSAVGASGGLVFGLALGRQGRWKVTLLGGLVGAAAATVVYEIVAARLRDRQDRSSPCCLDHDERDGAPVGGGSVGGRRGPSPYNNHRQDKRIRRCRREERAGQPRASQANNPCDKS